MPVHKIEIVQPPKAILHSDVNMLVYSDGVLLGELFISKGSIDWRMPKEHKPRKMTWEKFAKVMSDARP